MSEDRQGNLLLLGLRQNQDSLTLQNSQQNFFSQKPMGKSQSMQDLGGNQAKANQDVFFSNRNSQMSLMKSSKIVRVPTSHC